MENDRAEDVIKAIIDNSFANPENTISEDLVAFYDAYSNNVGLEYKEIVKLTKKLIVTLFKLLLKYDKDNMKNWKFKTYLKR